MLHLNDILVYMFSNIMSSLIGKQDLQAPVQASMNATTAAVTGCMSQI